MKSFNVYRLPIIMLCLGGVLVLAPQSRAQSDVAPDHFDGSDSWATAASAKATQKAHQTSAISDARQDKSAAPTLQPVAARTVTTPRRAATKNRKSTAPKSSN
jgi:hypothetical protein